MVEDDPKESRCERHLEREARQLSHARWRGGADVAKTTPRTDLSMEIEGVSE